MPPTPVAASAPGPVDGQTDGQTDASGRCAVDVRGLDVLGFDLERAAMDARGRLTPDLKTVRRCGPTGLPGSHGFRVTEIVRHVLTVGLVVILVSSCAGPITPGHGRVSGIVGGWPAHPTGGQVAPAPDKTIEFVTTPRGSRWLTRSGTDGRYFIDLAPANYEVHLVGFAAFQLLYGTNPDSYGQWPRVTVSIGSERVVNLIFDTGLR